jgi:hypothetical protein
VSQGDLVKGRGPEKDDYVGSADDFFNPIRHSPEAQQGRPMSQ